MLIKGLQKTTLIDYPGKIACTIFLSGCNFRCGYCHNPELVETSGGFNYSQKEILDFLEKQKKYLEGICITGGEPLASLDIEFLRKIKKMGYKIKIDTNGSFPERLKNLIKENLVDYIAMDIKTSKEDYETLVNSKVSMEKIEESIKIISNFREHEFRTTVTKRFHNAEKIKEVSLWLAKIANKEVRYFLQGFKNSGKVLDPSFLLEENISEDFLRNLKKSCEPFEGEIKIRI